MPSRPGAEWSSAVLARLAGPADALQSLTREIFARGPGEILPDNGRGEGIWSDLREFRWAESESAGVAKVALSTCLRCRRSGEFVRSIDGAGVNCTSAWVEIAFISAFAQVSASLRPAISAGANSAFPQLPCACEVPLWLGRRTHPEEITQAVESRRSMA